MTRALRIEAPGLGHHVMNRGAARRDLFVDDDDRLSFLDLVTECRERWGLRTHAIVLMDNHFHALVEDTQGHLSRAMRHLCGVHTQRFNRRHGSDGPLVRGRFRSRLVQAEAYLAEVVRYIHANPVQAGLVKRAGDYPWSSHRHYLARERPPWLSTDEVTRRFGGDDDEGRKTLDRFVHERIDRGDVVAAEDLRHARWSPVLGDEAFVEKWCEHARRKALETAPPDGPRSREPAPLQPAAVLEAVAAHFDVTAESLLEGRRRTRNLPRTVALLLLRTATPASLGEIAELLHLRPTSVTSLAHRTRQLATEDPRLAEHLTAIRARLSALAPGD